jgi:hypothetical protein
MIDEIDKMDRVAGCRRLALTISDDEDLRAALWDYALRLEASAAKTAGCRMLDTRRAAAAACRSRRPTPRAPRAGA